MPGISFITEENGVQLFYERIFKEEIVAAIQEQPTPEDVVDRLDYVLASLERLRLGAVLTDLIEDVEEVKTPTGS